MQIVAHRGWWLKPEEKNTLAALWRALEAGFGVEIDLRDRHGRLVVAHGPPSDASPLFGEFLAGMPRRNGFRPVLALNVKADGLQPLIAGELERHNGFEAYVFDMSVPDTMGYLDASMPVFVRQSEYEPEPVLYDRAAGVWLDAFGADWYDAALIRFHLEAGKQVAVVSPELHGRSCSSAWEIIRHLQGEAGWPRVQLCTDRPEEAREYFR